MCLATCPYTRTRRPASSASGSSNGPSSDGAGRAAGHGAHLDDLLTGQLSVSRAAFDRVGGFDLRFTLGGTFGNEDVDFGYRLVQSGFRCAFNPAAISWQRYVISASELLRRTRDVGQADVAFARKHPERGAELFRLNGGPFGRWVLRTLAAESGGRAVVAAIPPRHRDDESLKFAGAKASLLNLNDHPIRDHPLALQGRPPASCASRRDVFRHQFALSNETS